MSRPAVMQSRTSATTTRAARRRQKGEQHLLFRCHDWVLALPTLHVNRLLLPSEGTVFGGGVAEAMLSPGERLRGDRFRTAKGTFAAWDLGEMLALPPLGYAWILLQLPSERGPVSLALRTGTCFSVAPLDRVLPTSPALFSARQGALSGAFPTEGLSTGTVRATLGLRLDPLRLWTAEELLRSAQLLHEPEPHG